MIEVSAPEFNAPPVVRVVRASALRIWGITPTERLRRSFARAGIDDVADAAAPLPSGPAIVVRADYVLDEALVCALVRRRRVVLVDRDVAVAAHVGPQAAARVAAALQTGQPSRDDAFAGLERVDAADLVGADNQALRKREPPLLMSIQAQSPRQIEWQLFRAAYKGITDVVTKWVWPRPAFWVTRWCAERAISPNEVTIASCVAMFAALALFWAGWFEVGLIVAWTMTFLDTVDGKLARVTLASSRVGHVFDHGMDLLHPPFWWFAWWRGLDETAESAPVLYDSLWIVVIGYVLGRLLEGVFLLVFKFESHAWQPVDSLFRQIIARRNPNLLLLSIAALFARPDLGLIAVAVWTLVSSGFQVVRLLQAFIARNAGRSPQSWLSSDHASTALSRYAG